MNLKFQDLLENYLKEPTFNDTKNFFVDGFRRYVKFIILILIVASVGRIVMLYNMDLLTKEALTIPIVMLLLWTLTFKINLYNLTIYHGLLYSLYVIINIAGLELALQSESKSLTVIFVILINQVSGFVYIISMLKVWQKLGIQFAWVLFVALRLNWHIFSLQYLECLALILSLALNMSKLMFE